MHWGSLGEGVVLFVLIAAVASFIFGSKVFKFFITISVVAILLAIAGFFISFGIHAFDLLMKG